MKAGKHVMCEKPMAKTFAEAQEMVKTAKETGKILTIGYQNRYRSDSQYLKKACANGDLGEVYYAKAHDTQPVFHIGSRLRSAEGRLRLIHFQAV